MDAALLTPSKYIKSAALLRGDKTVTITGVKIEELEREDGTKEARGAISLAETPKRWVLNVTNVKSLVALFGRETDAWLGKKVTLFAEPNSMSDSGFAIRVRGSPEIEKDITFTLKLARKKPRKVVLKKTGADGTQANGNGAKPAPGAASASAEDFEEPDDEAPEELAGALEPLPDGQPL